MPKTRYGREPISDTVILGAIQRRCSLRIRGARVEELIPMVALTKRWIFRRLELLEDQGLVQHVPGAIGEWAVTPAGLKKLEKESR